MDMASAATVKVREVDFNGHGTVIDTPPVLIDTHNNALTSRGTGMVVKADQKLSEPLTVSKGTMLMLSAAPAVLMLVLNYGTSFIGWARDDQTTKMRVDQMDRTIQEQGRKIDKLTDLLINQQIKDAKTSGFNLGIGAAGNDVNSSK